MPCTELETELMEEVKTSTKMLRNHRVTLLNDENHTYDYVVEMLVSICGMKKEQAFRCAVEVDIVGKTIVYYSNKEKCEQIARLIKNYGADHRMARSLSGMNATVDCCS